MSSRPPPSHFWNSRLPMCSDSPNFCSSPAPHRHGLSMPLEAIMDVNVYQRDCINPFYVFGGPGNYSITRSNGYYEHQPSEEPTGQPPVSPESQNIRDALAGLGPRFNRPAQSSTSARLPLSELPPSGYSVTAARRLRGMRPEPTSTPVLTIPGGRPPQPPRASTEPPSPIRPDPFHQPYIFGRLVPSLASAPGSAGGTSTARRPENERTPSATPNRN